MDRRHQSCSVARRDLQPQRTGPRGILDILSTQFVSVDDEWNQAPLGILSKSFCQIERSDDSVERGRDDRRPSLENMTDVDVFRGNRSHSVPRTHERLGVSLIPRLTRLNQQDERLSGHSDQAAEDLVASRNSCSAANQSSTS